MNMRASRQSLAPLRARWNALAPREQNMTLLAGGVVALALLWWLALRPPACRAGRSCQAGAQRCCCKARCPPNWAPPPN